MSTFEFVEVGLPTSDDEEEWIKFWKSKSQPWRTEPRIGKERQKYLTERFEIEPDFDQGIYPFKDIKLSRADVEWLLATHEKGHGPVDWKDERQRERMGLDLKGANLRDEDLSELPLTKCKLYKAQLQGANLDFAQLQGAELSFAELQGANLDFAQLQGVDLMEAQLQRAPLINAQLQGAYLYKAQLQGANLDQAQLQGADLSFAQLQGTNLTEAQLQGAKLRNVTIADTDHIGPQLVDVQWGDTILAVVDWTQVTMLYDEYQIGQENNPWWANSNYQNATRAYRQLSIALRNQGLNEDAARFAFHAQRMQRKALWLQGKYGQYLFSGFLNLLAGYGYRFWRSFFAYAFVIGIFALIYHLLGTHPAWNESIVISMTAFHGRGFFPEQFHPGDPQALAAAIEAFVGLLIEITLIATLTQRLFGK